MENWNKEKVTPKKKAGLLQRLLSLAAAAALALSLVGCGTSAVVPGGSADVVPNPSSTAASVDAPFEMHFIDVGQALSVLVECDGQFMLYDGGNVDDGSLVVSYLQKQGVEELQYVFCSHAHEDHVGGLAAALAYFPANHVYSPVTEASTKCFRDFVKYTQQQGLQVEVPAVGTTWPLGSASVTMLGPVAQYSDTNDTSIVLRIDYGSTSFLLTGDMEKTAESDLVASGANLKADVLQVGHHGSSTSTGYAFLNAVLPEMGIISCGVNNKYGHPHEETHRGHRAFCRRCRVEPHRPGGCQHGTAGLHRQCEQQKVPPAHLPEPAGREESDPLLQLRRGHRGRLHALLHLHQVRVLPQSNPLGLPAPSEMEPSDGTGMFPVESGTFPDRQGPEGAGTA